MCVVDVRAPDRQAQRFRQDSTNPWVLSSCWGHDGTKIYCARKSGSGSACGLWNCLSRSLTMLSGGMVAERKAVDSGVSNATGLRRGYGHRCLSKWEAFGVVRDIASKSPWQFGLIVVNSSSTDCSRIWSLDEELNADRSQIAFQIFCGHPSGTVSDLCSRLSILWMILLIGWD